MSKLFSFITQSFKALWQLIVLIWGLVKWLISKSYKFILIIGSLILTIFAIKKIKKEDP